MNTLNENELHAILGGSGFENPSNTLAMGVDDFLAWQQAQYEAALRQLATGGMAD